jgi:N-methylhydantoinase A/oxoprolinase/acetone carboxylase beta subunit
VSLRHEVCPEYREYEAFNTVAVNAYVGPVTGRYLGRLATELRGRGVQSPTLLMTSTGGVEPADAVSKKPVTMLLSGPVAGVMGGLAAGRASGFSNLITLDVGGTSADIGVVDRGELRHKHWLDNEIGGLGLRLPMVDVSTIGAGGGSIAFIDAGGMLQVGPRSAGANPGPACYGLGATQPTVTDAQLVLGRLSEEAFLGGRVAISHRLAARAITDQVATPLGLSLVDAAAGIVRIATAHMVGAIELNSVRRGFDPRDFQLVAFGGAGPFFAGDISRELSIPGTLIPRFPGIVAAMGLLSSNVVHAYSTSFVDTVANIPPSVLAKRFHAMEAKATAQLASEGFTSSTIQLRRYAECRYAGQGYEVRVDADTGSVDEQWVRRLVSAFHQTHAREYSHEFPEGTVELVTIGLEAVGLLQPLEITQLRTDAQRPPYARTRDVWFEEMAGMVPTRIYSRYELPAGAQITGPALIEQEDSTVLVPPMGRAVTDASGNILITRVDS